MAATQKRKQLDLDRRILWNRAEADRLDQALDRMPRSKRSVKAGLSKAKASNHIPTHFDAPESSTVVRGSYDPDTETMTLTFKRDGKKTESPTYQYQKFPGELWQEFVAAESKGTFFSRRIRPLFDGIAV